MTDQKLPYCSGRAVRRTEEIRAAFEADYLAYQYRWVEFFLEHVADLSRAFRGDLQAMIVLALVGQVYLRALRSAAKAGIDPAAIAPERFAISASRIADITAIPRETVRRKLVALERRGWLIRADDSAWRLAVNAGVSVAREDLAELDRRSLERVAVLFRDLEALVQAQDQRDARAAEAAATAGAQSGQVRPPEG